MKPLSHFTSNFFALVLGADSGASNADQSTHQQDTLPGRPGLFVFETGF